MAAAAVSVVAAAHERRRRRCRTVGVANCAVTLTAAVARMLQQQEQDYEHHRWQRPWRRRRQWRFEYATEPSVCDGTTTKMLLVVLLLLLLLLFLLELQRCAQQGWTPYWSVWWCGCRVLLRWRVNCWNVFGYCCCCVFRGRRCRCLSFVRRLREQLLLVLIGVMKQLLRMLS